MTRMRMVHRDTLSCEPILRRMPNGELLLVSQCGGVTEPAPENRVYVFHSKDEGETWSKPVLIRPEDGKAVYLTEVSVIGEKIIVHLTIHNGHFVDWTCDQVVSEDNGYTWRSIGPIPGYETYTFPRGMIRLSDGRLMMAMQRYPVDEAENTRLRENNLKLYWDAQAPYVSNEVIVSSDEGETWQKLGGVEIPMPWTPGRLWIWSEPTIVELNDGRSPAGSRIAMYLRWGGTGKLWYSESTDGGKTFCEPQPTEIPNPSNKPKLLRMEDGRIALIHTPNPVQGFAGRNPLAIWLSSDELKSFDDKRIITDFPGAFCYPDGFAEGDHIQFAIEYNRHDILYIDADLTKEAKGE